MSQPAQLPAEGITRRDLLKGLGATLGLAAYAKALAPLTEWKPSESVEDFLQKHYSELSAVDLAVVLKRIEKDTKKNYGADVTVSDPKPQPGVKFGYALNLSICIGCRKAPRPATRKTTTTAPHTRATSACWR
jgi:molybdopterin-containing oxidoreductase family iron-sulfur binding subunit